MMSFELQLPELGENVESGDVVRVLVSPGDTVTKDQPIIELETDKATIEVPSSADGVVKEVAVMPGDRVTVGQVFLRLEGDGKARANSAEAKPAAGDKAADRPSEPTGGDAAEAVKGRALAAPVRSGRGEVVDIGRSGRSAPAPSVAAAIPASPAVRRMAHELGIELGEVHGSGPGGRILAEDLKAHSRGQGSRGSAPAAASGAQASLPDLSKWGAIERRPMRAIRRKTAAHVAEAWSTIPHVTQHDRADVTALEDLRRKYAPRVEQAGGKLTVTAIALKVAALALRQFPQFNAAIDVVREEIIEKQYVHVGVAVDTDRGLLVPVIRDADKKSITELSIELAQMADKARSAKLTLEEMQGGCFTITNLGGIGGTYFSPIINAPEVAVLGVSRGSTEPVFVNGEFVPRLMLPLSLSYDHRVIDGADGVRFLRWFVEALEQPLVMVL